MGIFNIKATDWTTAEPEKCEAAVIEKSVRFSGWSENTYPAVTVSVSGTEEKMDLMSWDAFEDIFPGDKLQITHQSYMITDYAVTERGQEYRAFMEPHTDDAVFVKDERRAKVRFHSVHWAWFRVNGENLSLKVDFDWQPPVKDTKGRLAWHGDVLDEFEY